MSQKINDGGPAFPSHEAGPSDPRNQISGGGLSMRDYFAAKAMQGMLADLPKTLYGLDWLEKTTHAAYAIADAMLKARQA